MTSHFIRLLLVLLVIQELAGLLLKRKPIKCFTKFLTLMIGAAPVEERETERDSSLEMVDDDAGGASGNHNEKIAEPATWAPAHR